ECVENGETGGESSCRTPYSFRIARPGEPVFEHRQQPLLSRRLFLLRMLRGDALALALVAGSLLVGAIGYHYTEGLPWLDAALNAAMILTGMGPVNGIQTTSGKVFATLFALYSGVAFLTAMAVVLAPVLHRFLHHFHLEAGRENIGR